MVEEWLIKIDGKEEGPLSIRQLKRHPFVTPDTPVRHINWSYWSRMRDVEELEKIFKEDEPPPQEEEEKPPVAPAGYGELILEAEQSGFPFFVWLLIALLVLVYTWYRLNYF